MTSNKVTWRAWLFFCLFLSGGIWGFAPALSRIAMGEGAHPLGLTLWQSIGGGTVMLISETFAPLSFSPGRVEFAMLALVLVNVVSYGSFIYLVRITGPVFASQSGYLGMAVGVGVGMMIYGERHSVRVWVATALLVGGLALVRERVHREVATA